METTRNRKRWLLAAVLVTVWALVLVGLAVWSTGNDPATVREQSDLVAGRQALDRTVETLRTEAAGPGVAVEVEPYQVGTGCRLSLVARGTEVDRAVVLRVRAGEEPEALQRLARRVPAQWEAGFNPNTGRFLADAGDFIQVVGTADGPGTVRLTASTGCRPGDDPQLDP